MKLSAALSVGLMLLAAGCGHAPPAPPPSVASPQGELTLGTGDSFDVRVFDEQDLTATYRVDNDGTIDYPLLGQLKVEGMEPHALAKLIQTRLAEKFLKNPQVSILIREQPSKRITVIGQVQKPGSYLYRSSMTIVDAIAEAGGFTPIASKNNVAIQRHSKGEEKAFQVEVNNIGAGRAPNVPVRPGDVITVPERIF